ncbi:peptide ABC transporter permease [Mesorhizobium soli]|uniref:Peptide ABC transporter permease n=1 Tax=Pseudaminobacter soli (ex Li et al. 2025) TaxID=1295366 RepID=A0A2P7SKU4_9HYPH|nr:peptide ABC transporter permease [Mesorhizobium soli]
MKEPSKARDHHSKGPVFSAEQARQGEIVLRTRTRRLIFIAGLAGIVVLALLLAIFAR